MVHFLQKMARHYPFIQQEMMHLPKVCSFCTEPFLAFKAIQGGSQVLYICICIYNINILYVRIYLYTSYVHAVMLCYTVICLDTLITGYIIGFEVQCFLD